MDGLNDDLKTLNDDFIVRTFFADICARLRMRVYDLTLRPRSGALSSIEGADKILQRV